jgi:rRNA-processing protein FCF1
MLRDQTARLENLSGTTAEDLLNSYHKWASEASAALRYSFELEQVESLVNTQRHDFLIAKPWADNQLLISTMIRAEQQDRLRVFKAALDGLEIIERRSSEMPTHLALVVPDTNVFLHQEQYFDELDWALLSNELDEFRVMIPMAVVRELDKGKRAQPGEKVSDTNNEAVRSRARVTSKRIRELFVYGDELRELGGRGSIEMLLDALGHRHLDDADTVIVERAIALGAVTGREVFILTSDGNMQFMARVAGLKVIALAD